MSETVLLCGWKGYIGYALLQRLLNSNFKVVGVDNNQRETFVKKQGSTSATEVDFSIHKNNEQFIEIEADIAREPEKLEKIFNEYRPDVVINLAHVPSAPYSQISLFEADYTLTNNFNGTNNLLWLIKTYNPDAHYITIGTAGEYNHYANIDVEEGYFSFQHNGRQSEECIFPRRPGSIYHTSKVASTYLIDFLTRTWDLSCTDVMQGIVFGLYTEDLNSSKNHTRFDSDECFGTVINRFCLQAILGEPLTVFGEGKHKRTFISLNDSIQALMIAVKNKARKGHVQVWNQLSEWHSMDDIANKVIEEASKLSIKVEKQYINTPRNEKTGEHYYNFITKKLDDFGYIPTRSIAEEIRYVITALNDKLNDNDKSVLRKVVIPKIKWNPK